jgi:hypothetical protein
MAADMPTLHQDGLDARTEGTEMVPETSASLYRLTTADDARGFLLIWFSVKPSDGDFFRMVQQTRYGSHCIIKKPGFVLLFTSGLKFPYEVLRAWGLKSNRCLDEQRSFPCTPLTSWSLSWRPVVYHEHLWLSQPERESSFTFIILLVDIYVLFILWLHGAVLPQANSLSACQENSRLLWNQKDNYRVYGNPPLDPTLGQANRIHILPDISLGCTLILYSHLRLGLACGLCPTGFATKLCTRFSSTHARYLHSPSHTPSFGHPNNVLCRVQIMKLLIM